MKLAGILEFVDGWYGAPLWVLGLCTLPFIWGNWTQVSDPLLWRAADFSDFGGHHTLILVAVATAFVVAWKGFRMRPSMIAMGIIYLGAWHEMLWWVTDTVWFAGTGHVDWALSMPGWLLSGYLFPLTLIAVMFYVPAVRVHWKYLGAMGYFYMVWLMLGFPVTVNFGVSPSGITSLYYVPWVNGLEILSWVYALATFFLLCRKELTLSERLLTK